jgi:hypothetical protein
MFKIPGGPRLAKTLNRRVVPAYTTGVYSQPKFKTRCSRLLAARSTYSSFGNHRNR